MITLYNFDYYLDKFIQYNIVFKTSNSSFMDEFELVNGYYTVTIYSDIYCKIKIKENYFEGFVMDELKETIFLINTFLYINILDKDTAGFSKDYDRQSIRIVQRILKRKCKVEIELNIPLYFFRANVKNAKKKEANRISEICGFDLIVLTNVRKCIYQEHKMKEIIANVNVVKQDGSICIISLPATYCHECNVYFVYKDDFKKIKKHGHVLCRVDIGKIYGKNGGTKVYIKSENESIIHQMGYNVINNNYTEEQRRTILINIMESGGIPKAAIKAIIKRNMVLKATLNNYTSAVEKWESDYKFLDKYNPENYEHIYANKIRIGNGGYKTTQLPVYIQKVLAGSGMVVISPDPPELVMFPYSEVPKKATYCVRVAGNSMEPTIKNGELLFVDGNANLNNRDIGIFLVDGCESLCKEYHVKSNGEEELISHNPEWRAKGFNEYYKIEKQGKVVGHTDKY